MYSKKDKLLLNSRGVFYLGTLTHESGDGMQCMPAQACFHFIAEASPVMLLFSVVLLFVLCRLGSCCLNSHHYYEPTEFTMILTDSVTLINKSEINQCDTQAWCNPYYSAAGCLY